MAGHSKFKNIMHRKGAQDKLRAKLFSRLGREISVAVRIGGSEVDSNIRLRAAINSARPSYFMYGYMFSCAIYFTLNHC